jgi:hypothetical protein
MNRNRRLLIALLALVIGLLSVPLLGSGNSAEAGTGVKFFVVEWRLTWERDGKELISEDGSVTKLLTLKIQGRASLGGRDYDKDFEMEIADAGPFLEILRTCGTSRISGSVVDYDTKDNLVVGKELDSLQCRAILK